MEQYHGVLSAELAADSAWLTHGAYDANTCLSSIRTGNWGNWQISMCIEHRIWLVKPVWQNPQNWKQKKTLQLVPFGGGFFNRRDGVWGVWCPGMILKHLSYWNLTFSIQPASMLHTLHCNYCSWPYFNHFHTMGLFSDRVHSYLAYSISSYGIAVSHNSQWDDKCNNGANGLGLKSGKAIRNEWYSLSSRKERKTCKYQ